MSHLVIMAAGTGGHVIPGLAVAREMQQRGWSVSWLGTREGMENKLVPPRSQRHRARPHRFLGPARQGAAAHPGRRPAAAAGLLAMPGHPAPARRRRGAGHGRLCLLPGRADGLGAGQAAGAGQCRRLAADEQQGAAASGRPGGLRLRRRRRRAHQAGSGHRQPGARRDRGPAGAGRALCRAQRRAAAAGGGRQPGCQGAERHAARGAGPVAAAAAPARHPPDRQRAHRRRAQRLSRSWHRGRGAALHRRHGGPAGRSAM